MANTIKCNNTNDEIYYPTNDYLFKRIFGYKGNEKITEGLIGAILGKQCEVIEVKSDEVTEKDLRGDKVGILDVFIKEKDGTQTNIEMQVAEYDFIIDRVLFYWAKKYIESLHIGEDYQDLKATKVILITNFEIEKLTKLEEIVNSFKILDTKTGKLVLTEKLELVIIELPKMKKYTIQNRKLESWLKFIKNPNSLGAMELGENKEIQKAKEEYDKIMADEHEKMLIKLREKYWLDYNSMKNASYDKGKSVGIKQRREEKARRNCQKNVNF